MDNDKTAGTGTAITLDGDCLGEVPMGLKMRSSIKTGGCGIKNTIFAKQIINSVKTGSMKELPESIFNVLVNNVIDVDANKPKDTTIND